MKTLCIIIALLGSVAVSFAATTINPGNKYAYGANIGWLDWRGDSNNGAVIGSYYCTGFLYAANVGWINLGSGTPANQIQYQNNSATDFGVNHDGVGNLRGYAWGANIGWVNFENTGAPTVDLLTGKFSGYIWSANCGWISLSNAVAHVQTDSLWPGPLSTNGLPIPWLLANFGTTNINASADTDGDGHLDSQEYLAGTNPNDSNSVLRITDAIIDPGGTNVNLTWSSVPTRLYYIQKTPELGVPSWADSGLGLIPPEPGISTTASFTDTGAPYRFYRIEAVVPLSP